MSDHPIPRSPLIVLAVGLSLGAAGAWGEENSVDARLLRQLQETIAQQQEQLRQQAAALERLQKQVDALKQTTVAAPDRPAPEKSSAIVATVGEPGSGVTVGSATPGGITLNISGQVNRAVNVLNDGKNTGSYFVDHATSGTRVQFLATGRVDEDLSVGSRIEVAIAPDNSSQVSQSAPNPGDSFNQRWAEVSLTSARYGKLSLGKGDTASNTTAEADLSGTLAVQNSSIADIVWGMLFRERRGDHALTNIRISNAFFNLDGLNRESRLRYDTPTYRGLSVATSLVSNHRSDIALFWDGADEDFQAVARAALSNPNLEQAGNRYDGSFSLLHKRTGLNLTLSAGIQKRDSHDDDRNLYGKIGWLTRLNRFGKTAFVVDYTRADNTPAAHDSGHAVGAGINQFFDKYGTEVYLQYRRFSLDRRSGPAVEDVKLGTVGARIRF